MLEQAIRPQEFEEANKKFTVEEIEEIFQHNLEKESFLPKFLSDFKKWEFESSNRNIFHKMMHSKSDWKEIMDTMGNLDREQLISLAKMRKDFWNGVIQGKESAGKKISLDQPFGTEYKGLKPLGIMVKMLKNPQELNKLVIKWQEREKFEVKNS